MHFGDRYETTACLGENAVATTWWAREIATENDVVVRVPSARLQEDPSFGYLLERTALEMLRSRHPHLVALLDVGREDGVPFVVTEYVDGASLAQHLVGTAREQTPDQIGAWLDDIAEALDFVHAKKAVHGGVRPEAILLHGGGRWKLTDYVFASALAGAGGALRAEVLPDRPPFTAPEARGGTVPLAASDQYALATCVAQALLGDPPPEDPADVRTRLEKRISPEGADAILRALSPDLHARFASCYEFATAFGEERERTRARAAPPRLALPVRDAPLSTDLLVPLGGLEVAVRRRCWRIRVGPNDEYARVGREGDFVAVDWSRMGDLGGFSKADDDALQRELVARYGERYGASDALARVEAGQLWRFLREMSEGDLVLVPNPQDGVVHFGRIAGEATFEATPHDGCRLPRRRAVAWFGDLAYGEVPYRIRQRLGGDKALISLEGRQRDVEALLRALTEEPPDLGRETRVLGRIRDSLQNLTIDQFLAFLRQLFVAVGYDAMLLPGETDDSWEAVGTLSPGGLAEVVLRSWVLRTPRPIGAEGVIARRGTLGTEERGAILAIGGFTERARAAAGGGASHALQLVDGAAMAALALQHWELLPEPIRDKLGVERVEEASIRVHYRPR